MAVRRALVGIALMASSCLADLWVEVGEAGRDLATANVTDVAGTLDAILGNLAAADPNDSAFDVDLYRIYILDPVAFSASTVNSPGVNVSDPQLFLFNAGGLGVYMNDDDESGLNGSQSLLPAGHAAGPLTSGFYYLGIGWWDNEPLGAGGRIFSEANFFGTNGPDFGAGGADPLAGWTDSPIQRPDLETAYQINLTGAATIPEPATVSLFGTVIAAFLAARWRRGSRRP